MVYHHTLRAGAELEGTYTILSVLGSGGFANTYKAHDNVLKRDVAIKEYFPGDIAVRAGAEIVRVKTDSRAEQFRWGLERFAREAQTLATFRHPNIVRVFRSFAANETAYMVLEFVEGDDMESWLAKQPRRLSQDELDKFMARVLNALEVIHKANILHRDIKPANIYIRASDKSPVLLDFGAARSAVSELTGTTNAIVSRGYSPHEAYASESQLQGPWTDIYGLAATVYRALSGDAPPESASRILDAGMVPASKLPGVSAEYRASFLAAIDHALEVMPKNRPQSVAAWQAELQILKVAKSTTQPILKSVTGSGALATGGRSVSKSQAATPRTETGQTGTGRVAASGSLNVTSEERENAATSADVNVKHKTQRGGRVLAYSGGALVLTGGLVVAALQMEVMQEFGKVPLTAALVEVKAPVVFDKTVMPLPNPSPPPSSSGGLKIESPQGLEDAARAEREAIARKTKQDEENARVERAKREADELRAKQDEDRQQAAKTARDAEERDRLQKLQDAKDEATARAAKAKLDEARRQKEIDEDEERKEAKKREVERDRRREAEERQKEIDRKAERARADREREPNNARRRDKDPEEKVVRKRDVEPEKANPSRPSGKTNMQGIY